MGVEKHWHSWFFRQTPASSLFRHFCHVTKWEVGLKSVNRAFMGIKMTAQVAWYYFRSKWIVSMTSWTRYDVISKNFISPFFIGNHVSKSTKRAKYVLNCIFIRYLVVLYRFLKNLHRIIFRPFFRNFLGNKSTVMTS